MNTTQELLMQQLMQCMNLLRRNKRAGRGEAQCGPRAEEQAAPAGAYPNGPHHGGQWNGRPWHGGGWHDGQWRGAQWHGEPPHGGGQPHRAQGRLLMKLLEQDGMALREIVQEMDIRPSSATELVAKLEQAGLVERRSNPEDKRVTNVYLTEAGRERAEEMQGGKQQRMEALFGGLTQEEQQQLSALLGKLIESLKEEKEE